MTTANELRKAIRGARLPARERYVFRALLDRADDKTTVIPDRYQPRGLGDGYFWGVSRRTVQRALPHLAEHGWVTWTSWTGRPRDDKEPRTEGRRGHPKSHYAVHPGEPCNCPPKARIERQDDAETKPNRAPGWPPNRAPGLQPIERRKFQESAGQPSDSVDRAAVGGMGKSEDPTAAAENQTENNRCPHDRMTWPPDKRRFGTSTGIAWCECCGNPWNSRTRPGRFCKPCSTPADSICPVCEGPLDPVLTSLGYRTHPGCDPAEIPTEVRTSALRRSA